MKHLQSISKLKQASRARGIHVINSFIPSCMQQYETQGATSELLQGLSLILNAKF
jgi:hypothetical protein